MKKYLIEKDFANKAIEKSYMKESLRYSLIENESENICIMTQRTIRNNKLKFETFTIDDDLNEISKEIVKEDTLMKLEKLSTNNMRVERFYFIHDDKECFIDIYENELCILNINFEKNEERKYDLNFKKKDITNNKKYSLFNIIKDI